MVSPSVVIRCGNDSRVLDCIRSIDLRAEVVVAFTGPTELAERIRAAGAICIPSPAANLSRVSNIGFEAASSNEVVFTDSDTTFEPGCLQRFSKALRTCKVAKAHIRFDSEGPFGFLTAEARDYVNSLPLVYTPGVAVRRDLLPEIGGFLFNDPVPYAVDADLDFRIRKAKVRVAFLENAWIRHASVPIRQDIRAAYRIGAGCRKSLVHWNQVGTYGRLSHHTLKGVKPEALPDVLRQKGVAVLAYQCLWDLSYWLGFFRLASSGQYLVPA